MRLKSRLRERVNASIAGLGGWFSLSEKKLVLSYLIPCVLL
jgi:hypothetical protein